MFDFFKKKKAVRQLNHPRDLCKGDLLTLKPRTIVPENLQSQTLTVEAVQAYQYSEGLVPEFVLRTTSGETLTLQCSQEEDGEYLTLAKKLSHSQVIALFDQNAFAENFGEDFAQFGVNAEAITDDIAPWLANNYSQSIKDGVAYFYNSDKRSQGVSDYKDNSEELRFHECHGEPDQFSLNIEIWEDGSTDVFAELSMPLNVIEDMWPNGSE